MIPYENSPHFSSLYEIIKSCFGDISDKDAHKILRETILAPGDYDIAINNKHNSKQKIAEQLSQFIIDKCSNNNAEAQYIELLENASMVIKHMNDGYISTDDYQERTDFLQSINKQEFELFITLAIISTDSTNQNSDLYQQLIFKIRRLREINDLIINFTRNAVDIEIDRAEFERAKPIYKMLKSLQGLGYGYRLSHKECINLNIYHDDDEDLSEDYAFSDWIKRLMLLELRKQEDLDASTDTNTLSDMFHNDEKVGYTSTFFDDVNTRIAELRGTLQKRRFDSTRFNVLENGLSAESGSNEL